MKTAKSTVPRGKAIDWVVFIIMRLQVYRIKFLQIDVTKISICFASLRLEFSPCYRLIVLVLAKPLTRREAAKKKHTTTRVIHAQQLYPENVTFIASLVQEGIWRLSAGSALCYVWFLAVLLLAHLIEFPLKGFHWSVTFFSALPLSRKKFCFIKKNTFAMASREKVMPPDSGESRTCSIKINQRCFITLSVDKVLNLAPFSIGNGNNIAAHFQHLRRVYEQ